MATARLMDPKMKHPDPDNYTFNIRYQYKDEMGKVKEKGKTIKVSRTLAKKTVEKILNTECVKFHEACKNNEFITRKEKRQQLKELEAEEERQPTIEAVREIWLKSLKGEISDSTINSYAIMSERLVKNFQGEKIKDITVLQLVNFLDELKNEGLKTSTVKHYYVCISLLFKYAYKLGYIVANPMEKVDAPRESKDIEKEEAYCCTPEELQLIQYYANLEKPMVKTIIYILVNTGMRGGELCALTWDCVDLNKRVITVKETTAQVGKENQIHKTKNGTTRDIPIIGITFLKVLEEYKAISERKGVYKGGNFLLQNKKGKPFSTSRITNIVKKFIVDHGLSNRIHPHIFRHSFTSYAINALGVPAPVVSKILGHKKVDVTLLTYNHVLPNDIFKFIDREQDLFKTEKPSTFFCS